MKLVDLIQKAGGRVVLFHSILSYCKKKSNFNTVLSGKGRYLSFVD